MPELLWVVAFVAGLCVIEWWYIRHNELTISEHVQRLNAAMPRQVLAGIMFGLGAIAGWFVAHFTS
jgi:hypothetical protein